MKSIEIDRSKQLRDQPETGHNRWHPDIPPLLEADEGEEVLLETRDALDGQFKDSTTPEDFANIEVGLIHPLTGPVFVKGAAPGDLLEIEFVEIRPLKFAWTAIIPGFGFLRDREDIAPFFVPWTLADNFATSPALPGVRIPGAPFMGMSGIAPSHAQVAEWKAREDKVIAGGGVALPPDAGGAVPPTGVPATEGLRTLPPREVGGNFDVKQLTGGSKLLLPVAVDGALFSTGDAHFAQGDGEVCVSAVEMDATAVVRFRLLKGEAERHNINRPRFTRDDYWTDPQMAAPRKFTATMGMPIREDGENEGENLTLACRDAVLGMINLLGERGWTREQAYVICSVAVDLKISNVVDVPNYVVSACLPEDIFV